MRKLFAIVLAGFLALGFAGLATAEPGPNGNNEHGLCTAFFNGQKNGHDKNGQPGPFQALEDTSREYTDSDGVDNDGDGEVDETDENQDLSAAENVYNFCVNNTTIGGQPSHGRYSCEDGSTEPGTQPECENNPAPGKS